jgi:hypothetical protein
MSSPATTVPYGARAMQQGMPSRLAQVGVCKHCDARRWLAGLEKKGQKSTSPGGRIRRAAQQLFKLSPFAPYPSGSQDEKCVPTVVRRPLDVGQAGHSDVELAEVYANTESGLLQSRQEPALHPESLLGAVRDKHVVGVLCLLTHCLLHPDRAPSNLRLRSCSNAPCPASRAAASPARCFHKSACLPH